MVYKLSTISSHLRRQVDLCYQLIETKMHNKLLNLFKETDIDNQEVLDMLLKDCSTEVNVCFLLENCNPLHIRLHCLFHSEYNVYLLTYR